MNPDAAIRTYLALTLAVIFWGLSFVATKIALLSIPAFTLIFARFAISSGFFILLLLKRGFPRMPARDHWILFLTALFEPGLYFVFETTGLQYTSAPKASLIIAAVPLAVMVLAALILKEKARPASIFGIFISLAGIWILITGDPEFSWNLKGALKGDLLIIGAVFSAALYMICARNLGKRYSSVEITSLQTLYGAVFFTPAFLWELPRTQWAAITGESILALVYLTLFATMIAFLCYNFALTQIPAARASVFINGIPLVTAFGAWLLLGDTLTLTQAAGGAMVLVAVVITSLPDLRRSPAANKVSSQSTPNGCN